MGAKSARRPKPRTLAGRVQGDMDVGGGARTTRRVRGKLWARSTSGRAATGTARRTHQSLCPTRAQRAGCEGRERSATVADVVDDQNRSQLGHAPARPAPAPINRRLAARSPCRAAAISSLSAVRRVWLPDLPPSPPAPPFPYAVATHAHAFVCAALTDPLLRGTAASPSAQRMRKNLHMHNYTHWLFSFAHCGVVGSTPSPQSSTRKIEYAPCEQPASYPMLYGILSTI